MVAVWIVHVFVNFLGQHVPLIWLRVFKWVETSSCMEFGLTPAKQHVEHHRMAPNPHRANSSCLSNVYRIDVQIEYSFLSHTRTLSLLNLEAGIPVSGHHSWIWLAASCVVVVVVVVVVINTPTSKSLCPPRGEVCTHCRRFCGSLGSALRKTLRAANAGDLEAWSIAVVGGWFLDHGNLAEIVIFFFSWVKR